MQRTDQNPNGIIVLTEDSMPQLARCVADILREEFRVSSPSMKSSIPAGSTDELISKARACEILDRCRTGKVMKYDSVTGHRIKDDGTGTPITWVHTLLKRNGALAQGWELSQCLFGEHLLARYPDKPVALVESEKTAVVCASINPDCVWLATGGKGQLNDRVIIVEHAELNGLTQIGALVGKAGKIQKDNGE